MINPDKIIEVVERIAHKFNPERIILFGSYAYGRPTKASDIDIAVISDKFKRMDDIKRIMLLSDYARRVKSSVDIDPIGFTEEELKKADYFDIAGEIAEKGIVVYEAT